MTTLASLALVILAQASSVPPPTVAVEPSSKWMVDYEEGMCVLSRRFGTGERAVDVGFRPMARLDQMQILLVRSDGGETGRGSTSIGFDKDPPITIPSVGMTLAGGRQRAQSLYVGEEWLDRMRAATTLTISTNGGSIVFALRNVAAAVTALDTCQDQLLRRWKLDPAMLRDPNRARLRPNLPRWFNASDYPLEAIRAHQQGRVVVVLSIRPDGRPDTCSVAQSAGGALDAKTCALAMQNARFNPARDGKGQPTRGAYILPVRWVLPSE